MAEKPTVLSLLFTPRGLSRVQGAAYVGVGTSKFDEMVEDGRMPRPKQIGRRRVWDRFEVDAAFEALPSAGANPWDEEVVLDD